MSGAVILSSLAKVLRGNSGESLQALKSAGITLSDTRRPMEPDALALSRSASAQQPSNPASRAMRIAMSSFSGTDHSSEAICELALLASDPEDIRFALNLIKQDPMSLDSKRTRLLGQNLAIRELGQGGTDEAMVAIKQLVEQGEPDVGTILSGLAGPYSMGDPVLIRAAIDEWGKKVTPTTTELLTWAIKTYQPSTKVQQEAINALAERSGDSISESLVDIATRRHLQNGITHFDYLAPGVIRAIQSKTTNEAEKINRLRSVGMAATKLKTVSQALDALKDYTSDQAIDAIEKLVARGQNPSNFNTLEKNRQTLTLKAFSILGPMQWENPKATVAINTILKSYRWTIDVTRRFDTTVNTAHRMALGFET
jgi:hypothetical protein